MNDQELAEYLAIETGKVLLAVSTEKQNSLEAKELGAAGDLAGHEYLVHQLSNLRPLDHVLSEEGEDNLGRLTADRVWIVDPLDGTSHYSHGEPDFAVHVALWVRQSDSKFKLEAAAVSVPALNQVFGMAKQIADKPKMGPIRILVSTSRPPVELAEICEKLMQTFPERGEPYIIPMGSVGAKLAFILNGGADLYINSGGFYDWDIAAPAAVAAAHGLAACDLEGNEFNFNQDSVFVQNAVIGSSEFVAALTKSLA